MVYMSNEMSIEATTVTRPAWWEGMTCAKCGTVFTSADPMPAAGQGDTDICANGCATNRVSIPVRQPQKVSTPDHRIRCSMGHVTCDHCDGCAHTGTLGGAVRRDKTGSTLCEQCRHDRDQMGIINKRTGKVEW